MPIVRIDLIEGKSEEYRTQVGEIVYQTLVDVLNVPKGDRFQVITEHRKSALPFDRDYLGRPSHRRLYLLSNHAQRRTICRAEAKFL